MSEHPLPGAPSAPPESHGVPPAAVAQPPVQAISISTSTAATARWPAAWSTVWPTGWRNLARDKTDTLLLLAACLLVLLPHATHLPLWTSVCTLGILLWRAVLTWYGKRLPPSWMIVPIAMAAMGVVWLEHHRLLGREPGVAMLALLLACKLMEMHARRDLFVVIFLALFVILTNFLYSQSIAAAAMMVIAVIAVLTAQLSFQYTGRVPPLLRRMRLAAFIFAMAVPLALVLFVLFPRISGPLWGLPNDAHGGRTSLSGEMSPGNISHLAQSEDIAFRVKFDGKIPPNSQRYWRGPVMGSYDGRTWRALRRNGIGANLSVQVLGPSYSYQVTQEASGQRHLFALEVARHAPQIEQFQTGFNSEFEMLATRSLGERVRFQMTSNPQYLLQADTRPGPDWVSLPPGFNPRTTELALQLRRDFPDPARQADAILRLFRTQPFRYTLEPPLLGMQEMDDFLFNTRAGFCEHYAAAFVVLMRASGIPARVVSGYQGGEINPVDGFMIVRQSDAHAWAEVWLAGRGWVRYDPTGAVAPERVEKNLASALRRNASTLFGLDNPLITLGDGQNSLLARWRNNWNAVNNSWNQWVLDYSPKRQRDLLQSLGVQKPDWQFLAFTSIGLGAAVMSVMLLLFLRQRQQQDPYDALYLRLCQQLAKRGLPRAVHEGPDSYGQRLAREMNDPARLQAVLRFLTVYSAARYGPPAARVPLATLQSLFLQCR